MIGDTSGGVAGAYPGQDTHRGVGSCARGAYFDDSAGSCQWFLAFWREFLFVARLLVLREVNRKG